MYNIAILISGHLRTWEFCKQTFIDNFLDSRYNIDIYCQTYSEVESSFPTNRVDNLGDYPRVYTNSQISSLFENIPIVYLDILSENNFNPTNTIGPQAYYLEKLYNTFSSNTNKYDLIIKSRFDLILQTKLNYDYYLQYCEQNILFMNRFYSYNIPPLLMDHLAIGNLFVMEKYFLRFSESLGVTEVYHNSIDHICEKYNISRNIDTINSGLRRFLNGKVVDEW